MGKVSHHWHILSWTCSFELFSFPEMCYLTSCARRYFYGLMSLRLKELLKEGNQVVCLLKEIISWHRQMHAM